MILGFRDKATEDIFNGQNSKEARRIPHVLRALAARKLDMLGAAHQLSDLKVPPGNRLKHLKGNLSSFHSIRINDQYRIIFKWMDGNVKEVQIVDYH